MKGALFDVDGTLVDSMPMWNQCGKRYLAARGITTDEDLAGLMKLIPIHESGKHIKERYRLPETAEEITRGLNDIALDFYMNEAVLKPFIPELLEKMKRKGIPMAVATASAKEVVEPLLTRLGVIDCFCDIHTCKTVGLPKTDPDYFACCASLLGTSLSETFVFEDMPHAAASAVKAGLTVVGMYDAESYEVEPTMRELCYRFIKTEEDFRSFCCEMGL